MAAVSIIAFSAQDEQLRQKLLADAEDYGNAVVQVAGDEHGAPYSFTVGAWRRFGVAEVVVIGLPPEMAAMLVNAYVAKAACGERFRAGELYYDFFEDVPVTFERVATKWYPEYFGSAFLLYRTGGFPAMQIIVPASGGRWPWQPDAPEGFREWQPVLTDSGLPESWTPGVDGP